MEFIKFTSELKHRIKELKSEGKTIGFIPTMGALHSGHLSLVKKARVTCDIVVCSVFVNPTQFNKAKDLENYPRTIEADKKLLNPYCDILFFPNSVEEVYGKKIVLKKFDFGGIEKELEGEFRPGHFEGMANVVYNLFKIVTPDNAFFGLKDYQQYLIVCKMVEISGFDLEVVGCEIIREETGLARSSRNKLLSEEAKKAAAVINYSLNFIKRFYPYYSLEELQEKAKNMISGILEIEYLEIRNAQTLLELNSKEDCEEVFVCFAGNISGVRLIDNIIF